MVKAGTDLTTAAAAAQGSTRRDVILAGTAGLAVTSAPAISAPCVSHADLLACYSAWLHMERRLLAREAWPELGDMAHRYVPESAAATMFHFPIRGSCAPASSRAAAVLQAVGLRLV
jgi:hypothetical protein